MSTSPGGHIPIHTKLLHIRQTDFAIFVLTSRTDTLQFFETQQRYMGKPCRILTYCMRQDLAWQSTNQQDC